MCAPSLEALAGGGSQNRRDEGCLAITRVSSDNQYCLRIGGISCHENCDDGGASRILRILRSFTDSGRATSSTVSLSGFSSGNASPLMMTTETSTVGVPQAAGMVTQTSCSVVTTKLLC
ncbi:hypothetical protein C5167_042574 [Papaver somniferum]|uniref:Uncharacterized protein n=1 Tax=Papaver somniferum TaxID=3469 RepID=A0A4Y7L6I7_PAPSO|nr:hypothetical protein C5167_042574 [Papaver somniferum]